MSLTKPIKCVVLLVAVLLAADSSSQEIAPGSGSFEFHDEAGNRDLPIRVWYHCPPRITSSTRILFVMHGVKRNGEQYRDQWIAHAKRLNTLLVVPEFSKEHYPSSAEYNLGYRFDSKGALREESKWTFSAIEHLFDHIRLEACVKTKRYLIYGHSAGAQFVQRMVLFKPSARILKAIAANAGWYTFPSEEATFPYGLKGASLSEEQLEEAFLMNWTVPSSPDSRPCVTSLS